VDSDKEGFIVVPSASQDKPPSPPPYDDDGKGMTGEVTDSFDGGTPSSPKSPTREGSNGVHSAIPDVQDLQAPASHGPGDKGNKEEHGLSRMPESGARHARRRQYGKESLEALLQNLLGLTTSLLQLLSSGSSKRDVVAKSLLTTPPGDTQGGVDAEAIARVAGGLLEAGLDFSSGAWRDGGGAAKPWGAGVREGALSVLGNLALDERTAAAAAMSSASPHLAMIALRAAAAQAPQQSSRSSSAAHRACPRMAQSAPTSLLVRAASLLCNHLRAVPRVTSGASAREHVAALQHRDIGGSVVDTTADDAPSYPAALKVCQSRTVQASCNDIHPLSFLVDFNQYLNIYNNCLL